MATIVKALVLAAGHGKRLLPITDEKPKPLFPFFHRPTLDLTLNKLSLHFPPENITVNSHHLASQLNHYMTKNFPYCRLSHEPKILGTGGCLNPIRNWVGDDDLLIHNSDVVTDANLEDLWAFHQSSGAVATILAIPKPLPDENPMMETNSQLSGFGSQIDGNPRGFGCIHILGKEFWHFVPLSGEFSSISCYETALIHQKKISIWIHNGFWADLGTPERVYSAHLQALRQLPMQPELYKRLTGHTLEHDQWSLYVDQSCDYSHDQDNRKIVLTQNGVEEHHIKALSGQIVLVKQLSQSPSCVIENAVILSQLPHNQLRTFSNCLVMGNHVWSMQGNAKIRS